MGASYKQNHWLGPVAYIPTNWEMKTRGSELKGQPRCETAPPTLTPQGEIILNLAQVLDPAQAQAQAHPACQQSLYSSTAHLDII